MAKKKPSPPVVDYAQARQLLDATLAAVETDKANNKPPPAVAAELQAACDAIFGSGTQAFREVVLGCTAARLQNRNVNVRQPYVSHGPTSISLRTFDENVINPFLHDRRIPSSKGPYLAVFRRGVQFVAETRDGLRDKEDYDAMLVCVSHLESLSAEADLMNVLQYILYRFILLREASIIELSKVQRISLDQYDALLAGLLATKSGGRFPLILVVATFTTFKRFYDLNWDISFQGINVSDAASGAGGDVTIAEDGKILMVVEVTERAVDRARVVSTFNTKIAPFGIEDYLFFSRPPDRDARRQANQYFAQGHEVNFLQIKEWILMNLASMGKRGRAAFNANLLELLGREDVPRQLKVAWNDQVNKILSV